MNEIYREQDGHPEIALEPVSVLMRRVTFARLRAEGCSVATAAIVMGIALRVAERYETRRRRVVARYTEMVP